MLMNQVGYSDSMGRTIHGRAEEYKSRQSVQLDVAWTSRVWLMLCHDSGVCLH